MVNVYRFAVRIRALPTVYRYVRKHVNGWVEFIAIRFDVTHHNANATVDSSFPMAINDRSDAFVREIVPDLTSMATIPTG